MRRRDFLAGAAATCLLPYTLRASSPWGSAPDAVAEGLLLPPGIRAERTLEVFLYGGLGPFESFYVVDEYGRPDDPLYPQQQWYLFEAQHDAVFADCTLSDSGLTPFAHDALGKQVKLGPALAPLKARPDLLARMRILVQRHALEPHEAAIPLALSGQRLGSPRMAGMGAAVQRYFMERDLTGRRVPFSYVLYPDNEINTDNLRAASAVGFHPGAARPLDLRIDPTSDLALSLSRPAVGAYRDAYDALVAHYVARARAGYSTSLGPVRSPSLDDHRFATEALRGADALAEVLPADVFAPIPSSRCKAQVPEDTTAMGLNLAAHLLTHPTSPARHVTVVDGGMIAAAGGGGYDVHQRHLRDTTRNLNSTLDHLVSIINEPGEADPGKLDLDTSLIVLNTEFGRTPFLQKGSFSGTNHHPYGYVTVLLGGPIGPDQAGVLGAIGPDGWADRYVTPTEARAAVLAAMGIYPFTQESFAIGDLRERYEEKDGLVWLNEIVLGRRP